MILVNIESLSADELMGIAEQEGIGNIESLSREEIIELLREKYEEDDDQGMNGVDPNLRYLSGITDYRGISDYVEGLPGVEELPDSYPETEVHLLMRSSSWVYCYWGIAPLMNDYIAQKGGSVLLHVSIINGDKQDIYDVPVSLSDSEWNIGIPYGDGYCQVALVSVIDGKRNELAVSGRVDLIYPYWLFHKDEMADNDSLYRIYISLITSKDGSMVVNAPVRDIITAFKEEDVNE